MSEAQQPIPESYARNTYHNAHTAGQPSADPATNAFINAAEGVLEQAAELARVVVGAHQGAAAQLVSGDWAHVRKYFSLSDKYAAWADYAAPAVGFGIHAYIARINQPIRLTQEELLNHPEWKNFGVENGRHPPMRGWLAVPLIGSDGLNYGFIQVSDRYEGDFSAEDEANLIRLARLTSQALDALALVYFPAYREKMLGKGAD